ncbi:MAG: hypothetical protein GTO45_23635 [Candidatus Aminicenantes bacterium]|nr:hypothetical protein [Candidatus Aminicenantes bacterium]NIM81750.1 hypothetical protein [Candidatus Aminicenantes bacterium]NIN21122.1 hypothetical protein [Candidatus Aminicenantes bacterium]NIN44944.1 hypothetical protein [Candidatus Aminicenantes bacterium]NIN87758.1 hypothetical protein [Candidatus Aminicenantes bacterium]
MKKAIFILITLGFAFVMQALINMNDIVPVFPDGINRSKIESSVIDGTIHFFNAYSHANILMKEYEKSAKESLNYLIALEYMEKAITELEKAKDNYAQAHTLGKQAGYVEEMIQKFKTFDYDTYTADKQLNSDVMALVKAYFSEGNILGTYQQQVEYIDDILLTLVPIKEKLAANQLPDIYLLWQLLQQFSESSLFGNYCTMTAQTILSQ